jgi:hypothetical protein
VADQERIDMKNATDIKGYIREHVERRAVEPGMTDCWDWTLACNGNGYALWKLRDALRGEAVHRISHRTFKGKIPPGYDVDHLCYNRKCVNPDHLEAVTPRVNTQRAHVRRRGDKPYAFTFNTHSNLWYVRVEETPPGGPRRRKQFASRDRDTAEAKMIAYLDGLTPVHANGSGA